MQLSLFEVATGLVTLGLAVYYYFTSNSHFWSSRGVKGPKSNPFFGRFARISLTKYSSEMYETYRDESLVGLFVNQKPVLMIRDPELIKDVLVINNSVFNDRGFESATKVQPLSQHLFALESELWRSLRQKLSSVKFKEMLYVLRDCAESKYLGSLLDDFTEENPVIECLAVKFTTDVIGSCKFGLNMNAKEDEDEFRKMASRVFAPTLLNVIKIQLRLIEPWLLDLLSPVFYDKKLNDFFIGSIVQTMDDRKKSKEKHNDFIDLIMAIKDDPSKVNDIVMAKILIAALAFAYFVAALETSSTTISHALYELAHNQSIQDKLREEIIKVFGSHNGDLTYKAVKDMDYLDKVFSETLRKYPLVTVIQRSSHEPYTFAGTNVNIPKDTKLWIPVYAIHHDPEIYTEPEKFDPERFNDENKELIPPAVYLPIGNGPISRIGVRFGNYQTKVGLIQILKNYKVEVWDQTHSQLKFTKITS